MNISIEQVAQVVAIGTGATLTFDAWLQLLQRFGVKPLNFAMTGRWAGHWPRGVFAHAAIGKAPAVRGELAMGWVFHYATGVVFAALLVAVAGLDWLRSPSPAPAFAVGLLTVAAPWFVMQPAMGAGFASSRSAAPFKDRVRSLANHSVFGLGLYLAAVLVASFSR